MLSRQASATVIESLMHTIRTRHGSTWLNTSKIRFGRLVGESLSPRRVQGSGIYYSVAACWILYGSKRYIRLVELCRRVSGYG